MQEGEGAGRENIVSGGRKARQTGRKGEGNIVYREIEGVRRE